MFKNIMTKPLSRFLRISCCAFCTSCAANTTNKGSDTTELTTFLTKRPRQVAQRLPNQRARDIPLLSLEEFPGNGKKTAPAAVPNLQTCVSSALLKL